MTTIYVLERGSYSDYRILGVFSTREHAERIQNIVNSGNEYGETATIAEWEIDPGVCELAAGMSVHFVCMSVYGNTECCEKEKDSFIASGLTVSERPNAPTAVHGSVWARNEKHAIKIANEYRLEAIAQGRMQRR